MLSGHLELPAVAEGPPHCHLRSRFGVLRSFLFCPQHLKREGILPDGESLRPGAGRARAAGCENGTGSTSGTWGCSWPLLSSQVGTPLELGALDCCPELRKAHLAGSPGSVLRSPDPHPLLAIRPHTVRQTSEARSTRPLTSRLEWAVLGLPWGSAGKRTIGWHSLACALDAARA